MTHPIPVGPDRLAEAPLCIDAARSSNIPADWRFQLLRVDSHHQFNGTGVPPLVEFKLALEDPRPGAPHHADIVATMDSDLWRQLLEFQRRGVPFVIEDFLVDHVVDVSPELAVDLQVSVFAAMQWAPEHRRNPDRLRSIASERGLREAQAYLRSNAVTSGRCRVTIDSAHSIGHVR